nr:reverse transcriptase domain-containing protein [Tanacetum cinerariifolium]
MLVLVDFVILEMEEDSKVPLILGRPFLQTADAVIRVKQKQHNLGIGTERMTFSIDSTMKHSYSNDDTCFSSDVIDEILKEDFDVVLDEGSEILYSIEGTILEEKLFAEFDEFMAINIEENFESEFEIEEPPFEKITFNNDYKIKTFLEKPHSDLELKPLPNHLEYVFLEEPSFLPLLEDKNPFVQKQRRLNLNMQEVVKKETVKLLDTRILIQSSISLGFKIPIQKQDDKPRLICWIMLLQEFDIEIKDKKGIENVAANHLSRIDNDETSDDSDVDNNFPGETLIEITTKDIPWSADFANYLVGDIIPKGMMYQQKNKFFSGLKNYFWEDPYFFKVCSDGIIRRCISGPETRTILDQCHYRPTGGHYGPNTTSKKVLDSGFYWPTIIKEAHTLVRLYEACQKTKNISKCDEMPLNSIQVCEVFDIWGIEFMVPFSNSYKFEYILVVVDYVSKYAEAQALPTNDAIVVISFLKKLFCHCMPKALISD